MAQKPHSKPKLTDAERYQRFLEAAKAAGASDDPKDFDRAFAAVTQKPRTKPKADKAPASPPTGETR
jgi:hypothetical protein